MGTDEAPVEAEDPYWSDITRVLSRAANTGKRVLLPLGDWSVPGIIPTYYRHDEIVPKEILFDIYVVNKATIPSFSQSLIRRLIEDFHYTFGNAVFCVFTREREETSGDPEHLGSLTTYVEPRRLWRQKPWRCSFIHIPKAAGTAIWQHVAQQIPSNIYFQSNATLRAFEGDINAFELVGGHIHAETLRAAGWIGHNFAVLRDPIERALSFIAHARRLGDHGGTLDPSFMLAREAEHKLSSEFRDQLLREANQQVMMLGMGNELDMGPADVCRALAKALMLLTDSNWTIGMQDAPADLGKLVRDAFRVEGHRLPALNTTEGKDMLVRSISPAVRALYAEPGCLCADGMLVEIAKQLRGNDSLRAP